MYVQRVISATPVAKAAQTTKSQNQEVTKNVTNPIEDKSSKTSQILRNYFFGSQMVNPAFTGFPCSTSNFRVKELEDMPCTCCGRPMMTNEQVDNFAVTAGKASGKELDDVLEQHMPYFRAEEKAIVHYIQKQIKDMPDATLTTAITRTGFDAHQVMVDEQIDVIKRTDAEAKEHLGEKNPISDLCERTLADSFGLAKERNKNNKGVASRFNRTDFLSNIVDLEAKKGINHEVIHHTLDVAVQIPEAESTIQKMVTKYAYGGSDTQFAKRLIQKAVVTAEHIHPKSKGGPNATNNYMGECQECNGSRGNMSYDEWMKRYPNMPDNIQVHADAVTEEIIKGKIGGNYDDYPVDLKDAVSRETGGKVVLTVKNPEEIDKAREERGLPKPQADSNEKAGAAGGYQGNYHGNPATKGTPKPSASTSTEPQETTTKKTGKSGKGHKGHKGHKGGKKHVVQFPSQMTQAQQTEQTAEEEAA